jgi:hypothetical protein
VVADCDVELKVPVYVGVTEIKELFSLDDAMGHGIPSAFIVVDRIASFESKMHLLNDQRRPLNQGVLSSLAMWRGVDLNCVSPVNMGHSGE